MKMKKTWPVLLGLLLLTASGAQAQFKHVATNGTITITGYTGSSATVIIPSTIDGLPVTSIGASAFFIKPIKSITIPASVTFIGDYAFEDCALLRSVYFEGNAPAVGGPYAFEVHSQCQTTAYYLADTSGWSNDINAPYGGIWQDFDNDCVRTAVWQPETGSLEVTISPAAAMTDGARWQVDGGTTNESGAIIADLAVGDHTVTFTPVSGWYTPNAETVTIKNGGTTKATVVYKALPPKSAVLTVQVVGHGTASPNDNGKTLLLGKTYQMTAKPASAWVFSSWIASGSTNFVSSQPVLSFTMQSNLVLQANFIPTPFAGAKGTYIGLFMPNDSSASTIKNSGFFSLTVTDQGAFSGYLETADNRQSLTGQFDKNFDSTNTISLPGEGTVVFGMNLDAGAEIVTGSLTGDTMKAAIMAEEIVSGKVVYTQTGRYLIALSDENGDLTGSAVLNFTKSGPTTLSGQLPGGTKFSASSVFCPYYNADWPFFTPLDGNKGCLLGRMYLADGAPSGYFSLIEPSGEVIQIGASDESTP
jgi:hypothetical protein